MILWTGWGILAPFLIAGGTAGAYFAANSYYDSRYIDSHAWVLGACLATGGFLCWLVGRWLYGRHIPPVVDPSTGREVSHGASHTILAIPMPALGALAILAAIPLGYFGIPGFSVERLLHPPATPPPAAVAPVPTQTQFASVSDAQQAAIRLHPELGVAGSKFNAAFLALHKKYQQEHPEVLRDNGWPVKLADEVARTPQ